MPDWLFPDLSTAWQTVVLGVAMFVGIIVICRIIGLRSFAKFTTYDFAITIAVGSIVSSTVVGSSSLGTGLIGITTLLLLCLAVSQMNYWGWGIAAATTNSPLLLMDENGFLDENLAAAKVSKDDVIAKLRESNVLKMEQVRAVILEATGDMSVMHTTDSDTDLEDIILSGVRSHP